MQKGSSLNCIIFGVTTNSCPCGFYPDSEGCRCTPHEVRRYLSRVSGPILDRMDICAGRLTFAWKSEKAARCLMRWGLGCPQQAKRAACGGEAVIRISEKDILIHCLPITGIYRIHTAVPDSLLGTGFLV